MLRRPHFLRYLYKFSNISNPPRVDCRPLTAILGHFVVAYFYMNQYCKTILSEYGAGKSILDVCSAVGMPGILTVKQWLFNREYDYEYKGFRETFLRVQQEKLYIYYDELRTLRDELLFDSTEFLHGSCSGGVHPRPNLREAQKHYRDFTVAVQWYKKHLELLETLYDHHGRGLDFPIEGIHFDAILEQPKELAPKDQKTYAERILAALTNLGSLSIDTRSRITSSITRAEAEALLGTPLLYGRIHKKNRRKPKPHESGTKVPAAPLIQVSDLGGNAPLIRVSDLDAHGLGSSTPPGKYERLSQSSLPCLKEYHPALIRPFKIPSLFNSS